MMMWMGMWMFADRCPASRASARSLEPALRGEFEVGESVCAVMMVVTMGMVTFAVEIWRFEIADKSADGAATACTCAGAARSRSSDKVLGSPPHV